VVAVNPPISDPPPKARVGFPELCPNCYPLILSEIFRQRQRRGRADDALREVKGDGANGSRMFNDSACDDLSGPQLIVQELFHSTRGRRRLRPTENI
jgi:hypothetical protein